MKTASPDEEIVGSASPMDIIVSIRPRSGHHNSFIGRRPFIPSFLHSFIPSFLHKKEGTAKGCSFFLKTQNSKLKTVYSAYSGLV
jgi:hypothetical protein